jgi:hypothetical protein
MESRKRLPVGRQGFKKEKKPNNNVELSLFILLLSIRYARVKPY